MNKMKLPTIKAIMSENGCTAEAAESIRARLEVEADRAHFRKTGKHLLPVVSARDLERHPELAVQDDVRPKVADWAVDARLTTPRKRAFYLEAAIEDAVKNNDMCLIAVALGDVARSLGSGSVSVFMSGLSAGMMAALPCPPSDCAVVTGQRGASRRTRRADSRRARATA